MQFSLIVRKCSRIADRGAILACAVLLLPAVGWCTEGGGEAAAGGGSWLSLLFYVINFAVFVWILARYAAPPVRKIFADRVTGIKDTFARALKFLSFVSRSPSNLRKGPKKSRSNINQKTRNETIRVKKIPQSGGICILRRLPCGLD